MKNENLKINDLQKEYEKYELTEADKADMREILAQRERGELEFISHDEFVQHKKELFARLSKYENQV